MDGWIDGGIYIITFIFNIPFLLCQAPFDKTEEYSGENLQLFQQSFFFFFLVIFVVFCVSDVYKSYRTLQATPLRMKISVYLHC